MSTKTTIEWTKNDDGSAGRTWNVVTGCDKISSGCDHCYAENIARRFAGGPGFPNGFAVTPHLERLTDPLKWRKPTRVFVNSMSDMFHAEIPDDLIAKMFAVMAATPQHTYQILSKRHGRMRSLLNSGAFGDLVTKEVLRLDKSKLPGGVQTWLAEHFMALRAHGAPMAPLPNVHLGVSVEDQHWADIRIPALLDTPAAVRFISAEPLLGPLNIFGIDHGAHERDWDGGDWICLDCSTEECQVAWRIADDRNPGIAWIIAGAESGPGARPMNVDWVRSLRDQCTRVGAAFFYKQDAKNGKKIPTPELDGKVWVEMPCMPEAVAAQ